MLPFSHRRNQRCRAAVVPAGNRTGPLLRSGLFILAQERASFAVCKPRPGVFTYLDLRNSSSIAKSRLVCPKKTLATRVAAPRLASMSTRAEILWADFHDASNDSRVCRAQLLVLHDLLIELRTAGASTAEAERLLAAKRAELDMLKAIRDQSFGEIVDVISAECGRRPLRASVHSTVV